MEVATKIKHGRGKCNEICDVSTMWNEICEESHNQMKFTLQSGSRKWNEVCDGSNSLNKIFHRSRNWSEVCGVSGNGRKQNLYLKVANEIRNINMCNESSNRTDIYGNMGWNET